ncbi:hypothetical protein IV203_000541 [Nitzschia inconspicua]|uniref:Uncharacterized protein n=1 Tax=Nitzschia inconspicua TaxID=303405 RepID=A0A9K3PQ26_9STRA|nr:hypothetical protein IV203_000541 [Nitzschia inconspicua]
MTQSNLRTKYHVSFAPMGDKIIPNNNFYANRTKEELKELWYSREELMHSCYEAKKIVKLIHLVGGKLEEIDHSRHCVVGLEKYHGKKERERYRKMLIRSVLIRQEMNRGLGLGASENGCLSEISQMMSASFKDFALWQAAMHEFHAYGSSKPSQSLLASKGLVLGKRNCPLEIQIAKRPKQQCSLETTNALATTIHGKSNLAADFCRIQRGATPKDTAMASTTATELTNTAQNTVHDEISLHQDMVKAMEGYVARKRLRCEVATLVEAHQYQNRFHLQPLSYSPSSPTTQLTTENPLLQSER